MTHEVRIPNQSGLRRGHGGSCQKPVERQREFKDDRKAAFSTSTGRTTSETVFGGAALRETLSGCD